MGKVDLHMHSCFSIDGELTPEQLVQRAKKNGVEWISLTDHNSVRGVTRARVEAKKQGILFTSGVELDSWCGDDWVHILGYGIGDNDEKFTDLEYEVLCRERVAGKQRLKMVQSQGIVVDEAWIWTHAIEGVATAELIVEAALQEKRNDTHPLLQPYRRGGARSASPLVNFAWDHCEPGTRFYVPVQYNSAEKNIALIHSCGGAAVFAHPGISVGRKIAVTKKLFDAEIDGIEVFTSYHDRETACFYRAQAEKLGLHMTCGSDFHGKTKPRVEIGCADFDEDMNAFDALAWLKK